MADEEPDLRQLSDEADRALLLAIRDAATQANGRVDVLASLAEAYAAVRAAAPRAAPRPKRGGVTAL
jgi:hypothetical protein